MAITLHKTNFAKSTLASQLETAGGSALLATGTGALFPATGNFRAVIWSATYATPELDSTREIVTGVFSSGDTITVTRAQESTTAKVWFAGSNFALTITKGVFDDLESEIVRNFLPVVPATIAATGNTDCYMIAPRTGTLSAVTFSGVDVLAASDTNYITWTITNLGQAGAGSTVMLAATAANTTMSTGGTALGANTKRALTLNATPANLAIVAGDRLLIRAAATGTLANTVTYPVYLLDIAGTV
jgi:hypothetical protein